MNNNGRAGSAAPRNLCKRGALRDAKDFIGQNWSPDVQIEKRASLLAAVTRLVSNGVGVSASATDGVGTSVFVSANKVTQNGVAFVSLNVVEIKIVGGITTFKCGLYRAADEVLSESGNETTLALNLADAVLLFDCSPGGAGAPSGSLSLTFWLMIAGKPMQ